jgi:hypothetical protein
MRAPDPAETFRCHFWKGAKDHAAGRSDLNETTAEQIDKNWRRKNLYPRFRDGFLKWWNGKRRWINEEIVELPKTIKSSFGFAEIEGIVKVENLLCLRVGDDKHRYIYPYFSDKPALTPEAARRPRSITQSACSLGSIPPACRSLALMGSSNM